MLKARNRSVWLAAGAFLLAKFKWILALLKFSKFGGTLLSMAASLGAYAVFYGWSFAAAIVYLIFVHEMGHVIAAKIKGIRTSPAVFLPFVGAFIAMKDRPRNAATEAFLAYGGPLAGLISFLPAVVLYQTTASPFWALVVFLGAMLNLFNLLPVSPLDGGRIVSVLSTKIWLVGLLVLIGYVIISPSPIVFLILLFGLFTWWGRAREGYRRSLFLHERGRLESLRRSLRGWPLLTSTLAVKDELNAILAESRSRLAGSRKWFVPFLQDESRLARDQARIDELYAEKTMALLKEWEYQPVHYVGNDAASPVPNALLQQAEQEASARIAQLNEELDRMRTYYEASVALKWKVLAAYLALAIVLAVFLYFGHEWVEAHRSLISR